MLTKKMLAGMATIIMTFALMAPAAMAQSSQDGYIQEGPSVLDRTEGDGGEPPAETEPPADTEPQANTSQSGGSSDELPFTGLDLGLVAVAGFSLMLLGVGMRRLTRAPDSL